MDNKIKDVQFISIPENRKIGDFILKSDIMLPVQMDSKTKPEDIDLNSIAAGLIKVIAHDPDNPNMDYYCSLLKQIQPDVAKDLNIAAIAKSKAKDYEFAEELMLAVNGLTKAPESFINLAVLYASMTVDAQKKGDALNADRYDDKIIEVLNRCRDMYPDYAPVYSEISAYHLRHGDPEEGRDNLAKFVELTKDGNAKKAAKKNLENMDKMLASHNRILYAYDKMMMGDPEEALKEINSYLANEKPTWEAFFIRGWANRVLEDYDQAQKDLLESLKINPQSAEVYNELSICVRESGNIELAKNYLQIAVDLDEENVIYMTNLAFLYLSDNEFAQCREMIEKARCEDPEDPQLKYIIKQYEEKTGDRVSDPISEEVKTDEELENLKKQGHEEV